MALLTSPRTGRRFKQLGRVLIFVSACWWFFGQRAIVSLGKVDAITAGFWTVIVSGAVLITGVLAYCLGRYTFAD